MLDNILIWAFIANVVLTRALSMQQQTGVGVGEIQFS